MYVNVHVCVYVYTLIQLHYLRILRIRMGLKNKDRFKNEIEWSLMRP